MDHFGIGAAINAAVRIYFKCARRSGRTVSLVESVKNGDRIVFTNRDEAHRVKKMCFERGVEVDCIVCRTEEPHEILVRSHSEGRTIFDHSWVEQFYLERITQLEKDIDYLQIQTSGHSVVNQETKRKSIEIQKWLI